MLSLSFRHQYLSTKSECSIEEQSSSNQTYSCFLEKKFNDINKKKYVTERQGSLQLSGMLIKRFLKKNLFEVPEPCCKGIPETFNIKLAPKKTQTFNPIENFSHLIGEVIQIRQITTDHYRQVTTETFELFSNRVHHQYNWQF